MKKTFLFFGFFMLSTNLFAKTPFKVCSFPMPGVFFFESEQATKPTGVAVDVLDFIFKDSEYEVQYVSLPWKRCFSMIETGEIDLVPVLGKNKEREVKYSFAEPWFHSRQAYFYTKEKYPKGLDVASYKDLPSKGKICGLLGFNYENFGFKASDVEMGATNIEQIGKKLSAGFCATFIDRFEGVAAQEVATKKPLLTDNNQFGYGFFSDLQKEPTQMMILKGRKQEAEILNIINSGLKKMEDSKEIHHLLYKYLGKHYFVSRPDLKDYLEAKFK